MFVDVEDLGCDFYVIIGYKFYGLLGFGVIYIKCE